MATELMNVVVLKPVNTNDQTILKDRIDTSLFNALLCLYMEISLEVYFVGRDLKINVKCKLDN